MNVFWACRGCGKDWFRDGVEWFELMGGERGILCYQGLPVVFRVCCRFGGEWC